MKIKGKYIIACYAASMFIGTITARGILDKLEQGKTEIGYEKTTDSNENNRDFSAERDIIVYDEDDDILFNLLLNIFKKRFNIRTNIENQHTLILNGLEKIINNWGDDSFLAVQYDNYLGLLYDWDSDGYVDKLLIDGLTIDSFAHKIYSDDVFIDSEPTSEIRGSEYAERPYFTNVIINPYFKSTRDDSGKYYYVTFFSLTKDKSAINFENDEDCYIPSDLMMRVTEDGIIYGEGIVTKKRCEELLAEFLKVWVKTFEPEKEKELNLADSFKKPNKNQIFYKYNDKK